MTDKPKQHLIRFQLITVSDHDFGWLPHHSSSKLPDLLHA